MQNEFVTDETISQRMEHWIDQVVIGLSLCPFAAPPRRSGRLKIAIASTEGRDELLSFIKAELIRLDDTPAKELETTLIVAPNILEEFWDYMSFVESVDRMLRKNRWDGIYQLATFHPDYCFADALTDDPTNLTNRAPYPVFHLLREDSIEEALKHYSDPESIPDLNQKKVAALSENERARLFSFDE